MDEGRTLAAATDTTPNKTWTDKKGPKGPGGVGERADRHAGQDRLVWQKGRLVRGGMLLQITQHGWSLALLGCD